MSLFNQLKKLGLQDKSLGNLSDRDFIKIEKKLKAEAKLDEDFDINEALKIIEILKTNAKEVALLSKPPYKWFREILSNPNDLKLFKVNEVKGFSYNEDLVNFIEDNFEEELKTYINKCFKEKHYKALYVLLYYKDVFPLTVIDYLEVNLLQKLEMGVEILRLSSNTQKKQIQHLYNPFLYRSISRTNVILYEEVIGSLINLFVDGLKSKDGQKGNYLKMIYAMGYFKPTDEELKKIISQNLDYATERGVKEVKRHELEGKGGTYLSKTYNLWSTFKFFLWFLFVLFLVFKQVPDSCSSKKIYPTVSLML